MPQADAAWHGWPCCGWCRVPPHTPLPPPTHRRPQSTPPSLSGLTLLGSRIRQGVLTLHDDTNKRVGFAEVGDCTGLAERWAAAGTAASA